MVEDSLSMAVERRIWPIWLARKSLHLRFGLDAASRKPSGVQLKPWAFAKHATVGVTGFVASRGHAGLFLAKFTKFTEVRGVAARLGWGSGFVRDPGF